MTHMTFEKSDGELFLGPVSGTKLSVAELS